MDTPEICFAMEQIISGKSSIAGIITGTTTKRSLIAAPILYPQLVVAISIDCPSRLLSDSVLRRACITESDAPLSKLWVLCIGMASVISSMKPKLGVVEAKMRVCKVALRSVSPTIPAFGLFN